MSVDFEIWDVFTDTPFGGNQLGVIPDARNLNSAQMQAIAREFNFSESTFLLPPETGTGTAKVRIFTPQTELPFAGHPTIGTALSIAEAGQVFGTDVGPELVLEEGVGPISCSTWTDGDVRYARFATDVPFERLGTVEPSDCAACISLPASALVTKHHQPTIATKGLPFVFAELKDAAALEAATPDTTAFRAGAAKHPESHGHFHVAAYVRRDATNVDMRMFAPLTGVPEDPATGSAAAALGALLHSIDETPVSLTIAQGVAMGRPSTIHVTADGSGDSGSMVTITGGAVRTMVGSIMVV